MALTATKLADELKALGLYNTEADACVAWAIAFDNYFQDAVTNGVPVTPGSTVGAKTAMQTGLTGLSVTGAAALTAGIIAYWNTVASLVASIWPGTIAASPPPSLSAIQAALEAVFAANIAGALSKDDSMTAIAGAIHPNNLGGLATWPPPLGPLPIL